MKPLLWREGTSLADDLPALSESNGCYRCHRKMAGDGRSSLWMPGDDPLLKILQRLDVLSVEAGATRTEVGDLRTEMRTGFDRVERRLDNLETRVGGIETEVHRFNQRDIRFSLDVLAIERELAAHARERATVFVADLTKFSEARQAVWDVFERFGRLDAAISRAGGGSAWVPIVDSEPKMLLESVRNNLEVAYNLVVPALRVMLKQTPRTGARSRGRLVAVTAGSSLDPAPSRGIMGIGKAGVNTLMRSIAAEHKADGIVANAVVLGGVATDAAREYLDANDFAAAARPQEVADILAFHASDASSGINGELIHLNAREVG